MAKAKPAPTRARADNDSGGAESAAEWVAIDSLREWADNPRKNDGEPVRKVAESIKRLGWGAPIVARKSGEIIAGHTRWKAAKSLGMDRVPVRYVDLDPADARLMALADNRLNEAAEWDVPKLQELLSECSLDDVEIAGWSSDDLQKMADDAGANVDPVDVRDLDLTAACAEFWVAVRGPLNVQPEALQALKATLEGLDGVTVEVGVV